MKNSDDILQNNLMKLFRDLTKYWYLIAISLAIAIPLSILYLQYAAKSYNVSSSVLLQLEEGNRYVGRGGVNDVLPAFQMFMQDKNMQNEVYFMQSLPLVQEVINEMDLRTSYYIKDNNLPARFTFSYQNIYKNTPFFVISTENHLQPINIYFHISIIDEEQFTISASSDDATIMNFQNERIVSRNRNFDLNGTYKFGSLIENDLASFTILLNSNFDPERYIGKDLFFKFNNLNSLASSFKNSLKIDSDALGSSLAVLTINAENPDLGLDFLNALIDKYIESKIEEANTLANKTIEHIEHQLVDVTDELTQSEQQLQTLRSDHSVMNIQEKAQNVYLQLENSRAQRDETRRRLNHLQQLDEYFAEYKDSSNILAPSALGLTDPLLNNMMQELTALNAEKQRIISQDQIRNPRLQTIDITIDNLKNAISSNISFTKNTTNRELDDLETKIAALNEEFARLPSTQRELLGIERRFNLNDAVYTSLLERRIQAQIIKASKLPDAKIIEPPRVMGVASPKRMLVFFFAIFIGLLAPSVIILGIRIISNTISSKEDIKLITRTPVIGTIPVNFSKHQNVVKELQRSPIAESFHILRSNLVYYLRGETNKAILVTSTMPSEGKSFTSINVATSFALANSKTILVEFDLRNPNRFINEVFNAKELVGISSYLINKASLDEIIVPTDIPNLDIMPAGQIPPNPIELISTTKTHNLFNELKQRYDFIIIDTPPYGLVTDAFLLMNIADIKLYVARIGTTNKKALETNMEDLEEKNIKDLHLVVNESREGKMKYGHYAYAEKDSTTRNLLRKKIKSTKKKIALY